MLAHHRGLFGHAGETVAGILLKWCPVLFDIPLDPLAFRVVLAPIEMGPYNQHYGYSNIEAGFILLNRKCCEFDPQHHQQIVLSGNVEDVLVHELTHSRQVMLLGRHHVGGSRGSHRDVAWYQAVSEGCLKYLGAEFPRSIWPRSKSVRRAKSVYKEPIAGALDEVTVCHWPQAMRPLVGTRLPVVSNSVISNSG
jgi:hypothetical protein